MRISRSKLPATGKGKKGRKTPTAGLVEAAAAFTAPAARGKKRTVATAEGDLARKRTRVEEEEDDEDDLEGGSDSEGNEWVLAGLAEGDDDSDIDSDEAFGESDEEKFGAYTFRGSSTFKKAKEGGDREEEEEEDKEDVEDDFGDEAVDLATMLDDVDEDESDEDADDAERHARLRDRVDALDPIPEEPAVQPQGNTTLSLENLLTAAGKKQYIAPMRTKKKSDAPKKLAVPLPPRQQARLDRAVASAKAKEEIGRWQPTVIQNRRSDFLQFPLQDPDASGPIAKDKFDTQVSHKSDVEERMGKIMQELGMPADEPDAEGREDAFVKAEEAALSKMSIEEAMRRRAELRRARNLLFEHERKAARIAKIKSKAFRKRQRKQKEREVEKLQAIADSDDEDPADRDELDRKRAELRMSTKHKNSKWAKSLRATNRAVWDSDARGGGLDEAKQIEELKRRIAGHDADESDVSEDEDESGDDATRKQLDKLQAKSPEVEGLAAMKFMRAAAQREKARNDEEIKQLRKEMNLDGGESESEDEPELTRATFGPQMKPAQSISKKLELEEGMLSDEEQPAIIFDEPQAPAPAETKRKERPVKGSEAKEQSAKKSQPNEKTATKFESNKGSAEKSDKAAKKPKPKKAAPAIGEDLSDSESDSDHRQKAMIAAAFAGDDTEKAFKAEKKTIEESEDETKKPKSTFLPGWGSWGGEGLSKAVKRSNQRKQQQHHPLIKTQKVSKRRDKNLPNVILSERKDKKAKSYLASVLPHEFETRGQYEKSLRIPLSQEWTTKQTFQKATRPRVVVKRGEVISAIERPLV
ncbi:small-subunit processome [Piedraia hortae CBS 480.64]|uniref:Small-subunit processome n=1 Tax=Piedraia hortae CBS 480.64 TaxID=1314780 RepID=A0A6A7BXZ7_9PEZI|nr:small-subunit processome [Piedraia hortae CBS 480.64]